MDSLLKLADHGPVIPVIVIEDLAHAVPLAQALVAGGVRVLEVTLRSKVALQAIEAMARAVPEAIVGAGTLRVPRDAQDAKAAGAAFAVSPGFTPELSAACRHVDLPLLPGVSTASEVMQANDHGHRFLKLFPATAVGGLALLKGLAGPFPDVAFCPTGGIDAGKAPAYLALPNVACVGGSWMVPGDALKTGEPRRLVGALATEIVFLASQAGRAGLQARRLMTELTALAETCPDRAYARTWVLLADGAASFFEGRFRAAATTLAQAEEIFAEGPRGLTYEKNNTRVFRVHALRMLGAVQQHGALIAVEQEAERHRVSERGAEAQELQRIEGRDQRSARVRDAAVAPQESRALVDREADALPVQARAADADRRALERERIGQLGQVEIALGRRALLRPAQEAAAAVLEGRGVEREAFLVRADRAALDPGRALDP